ncbi:hypothetical protein NDU88_005916 [Pleurodeles waltl]|uniref:Uncharacterized protein n=1 Tax=Pleurodeles waltl TaxID=8319 RepID=A0AAV7TBY9_PLEWA|nr:hypothetical protein NDU88_005916 [Pleurodeles waltl]
MKPHGPARDTSTHVVKLTGTGVVRIKLERRGTLRATVVPYVNSVTSYIRRSNRVLQVPQCSLKQGSRMMVTSKVLRSVKGRKTPVREMIREQGPRGDELPPLSVCTAANRITGVPVCHLCVSSR